MSIRSRISALAALLTLASLYSACTTDFEVYAPEKEIRSVYGVLNPNDTVQFIRVARAYQVEGDALVYASSNDISMKGLNVKISGAGNVHEAVQVDNFPKEEGTFTPYHTVYKIVTDGSGTGREALVPGQRYTLEIGSADAPDYLTAYTDIPTEPELRGALSLVAAGGTQRCLPTAPLAGKYEVEFLKGSGYAFELRAYLEFTPQGGVTDTLRYGPTDPFTESSGCPGNDTKLCYSFAEKTILRSFYRYTQGQNGEVDVVPNCVNSINDAHLLTRAFTFEVTAMDEFMYKYLLVNDPGIVDLSGARPEYTNITGSIDAVGIFGSIHSSSEPAKLDQCSLALLEVNDETPPLNCSWED